MKMMSVRNCISVVALVLLGGCATSPVVLNTNYDFSKVHRVAVLGFESVEGSSESGGALSGSFEKELIAHGFRLVERDEVNRILKEQNLQFSGAVDPKDAIRLGNLLGVQALILGKVTLYRQNETGVVMIDIHKETKEPVFGKKRIETIQNGKPVVEEYDVVTGYNVQHEVSQEPQTYRVQAEVGAVVKMVDAQTGEIAWVGSDTEEGTNVQVASDYVAQRMMDSFQKNINLAKKKKN